jgi:dipeptidyl aminopeptidase/acylaminoacyl peptidase
LLGGRIEERKDLARRASPITYVSNDDPPFLLVHGDADRITLHPHRSMGPRPVNIA